MLCFIPACCEIVGYIIFGTILLDLQWNEAAILGCVMAAVSPAVVVPRMLRLQSERYGTDKGIPQMIMAGSSADDVFVIILFTAFLGMPNSGSFDFNVLWKTPVSIILGIGVGLIIGFLFSVLFRRIHIRDTIKVLLFLSFSFLFVAFENVISDYVPFSGLLAVIAMGAIFYARNKECTARLSSRYSKLWVAAEILLFVLVGATVDIQLIFNSGGLIIAVIIIALIFRMIGVYLSVIGTKLNYKERLFCMIAYTPKATVQAAIGGIPISMGLACGGIVLTAAVLSILITAPIGAFVTDISYKRLLQKEECVSL